MNCFKTVRITEQDPCQLTSAASSECGSSFTFDSAQVYMSPMKNIPLKTLSLTSLLFVVSSLLGACASHTQSVAVEEHELKVLSWSEYLSEDVVSEFAKEHGAKVEVTVISSNEDMLNKVQASLQSGGRGYDLIFPSDYMVSIMKHLGLLMDLDTKRLPFLVDLDPAFTHPSFDSQLQNAVPFAWGTTGVAVNTKLAKNVNLNRLSWKDMLEKPQYRGKVALLDDANEVLHVGLLALGKSWEKASEADVRAAFAWLKKNKRNIKLFAPDAQAAIKAEDCVYCQAYNGNAIDLSKARGIRYVIPKEGSTLWTDTMAIPKNAHEVHLAYALMNRLLNAEAAKQFTETSHFASTNAKAKTLLPAAIAGNASIYPDASTFKRLSSISEKPELQAAIAELWADLKK